MANPSLFDNARRWVDHYESPGGDPTETPIGPRYGTLEEQAEMARQVVLLSERLARYSAHFGSLPDYSNWGRIS